MTLTTSPAQFLLNDKPFRILPEFWRDRLEKMKAFGTVRNPTLRDFAVRPGDTAVLPVAGSRRCAELSRSIGA